METVIQYVLVLIVILSLLPKLHHSTWFLAIKWDLEDLHHIFCSRNSHYDLLLDCQECYLWIVVTQRGSTFYLYSYECLRYSG